MRLNSSIPPLFKFLPRAPIYKLFGRDLTMGVDHPERAVTEFFFKELEYCISHNYITEDELDYAIEKNYIRQDIRDQLSIWNLSAFNFLNSKELTAKYLQNNR